MKIFDRFGEAIFRSRLGCQKPVIPVCGKIGKVERTVSQLEIVPTVEVDTSLLN